MLAWLRALTALRGRHQRAQNCLRRLSMYRVQTGGGAGESGRFSVFPQGVVISWAVPGGAADTFGMPDVFSACCFIDNLTLAQKLQTPELSTIPEESKACAL